MNEDVATNPTWELRCTHKTYRSHRENLVACTNYFTAVDAPCIL
jgi:hypothetical protein